METERRQDCSQVNRLNEYLMSLNDENAMPFQCTRCGKAFKQSHHLKIHLMAHNNEGPHACAICDRTFNTMSSLEIHRLCHGTEYDFCCATCGKTFALERTLKQHSMTHSIGEVHSCERCGRSFKKLSNLERHLATHWPKYPFKCKICDKEFQKKGSYERHLKSHSAPVPAEHSAPVPADQLLTGDLQNFIAPNNPNSLMLHECEYCGRKFNRRSSLGRHYNTHLKKYPFRCNICEKGFQKEGCYKRHLKSHRVSVSSGQLLGGDLQSFENPDNAGFVPDSNVMFEVNGYENLLSQQTSGMSTCAVETPEHSGDSNFVGAGLGGSLLYYVGGNSFLNPETGELVTYDAEGLEWWGNSNHVYSEVGGNVMSTVDENQRFIEVTDAPTSAVLTSDERNGNTSNLWTGDVLYDINNHIWEPEVNLYHYSQSGTVDASATSTS